jgi:predicted alpha/beta superfamily hydrolase
MNRFLFVLALFNSIAVSANDYVVDTIELSSQLLNEKRQILIFKPIDLQPTDTVSLIYLPDGEFAGYRYQKLAGAHLKRRYVGIGILNTNRNRDLLPVREADRFLLFIQDELIPLIESGYRVDERILYGHSFAGGFAIYSMIQRPGLFNRYIASSPTPIKKLVDPAIYMQLDRKLNTEIRFYFSYGSRDMHQVKKWGKRLYQDLQGIKLVHINWEHAIYMGEDHNSSDSVSILKGILFD